MERTYWKCCIIRTAVARVVEELYHGKFVRRNEEGLKVSKLRPLN